MATTTVSDAVVIPQAKGTGLGSEDDVIDAAGEMILSEHVSKEHLRDPRNDLQFTGHDGTNDQIDVTAGVAYVVDDSGSTSGSRGSGGNPQVQSTSSSGYDIEIPYDPVYAVVLPTDVTNIDVSSATLNDVWLNITDVTSNNAVEIRTSGGGGTTTAPSDTFIKLGQVNPDDATADIRSMTTHPPNQWSPAATVPSPPADLSSSWTYTFSEDDPNDARLIIDIEEQSGGSGVSADLRLNGDTTANYHFYDPQGNRTRDATEISKVINLGGGGAGVDFRERFEMRFVTTADGGQIKFKNEFPELVFVDGAEGGGLHKSGDQAPLDSFTLLNGDSNTVINRAKVHVRRNI